MNQGKGALLTHSDLFPQTFSEHLLGAKLHGDGSGDVKGAGVLGLSQEIEIMHMKNVGINPIVLGSRQCKG